jgi:osmotically-inducible protein OsmY
MPKKMRFERRETVGRTDEEIKKNLIDQLYWDSRVDASRITVEVNTGKVKLSGTVPSYWARRNAERDAWAMPGVIVVDNQIHVGGLATTPSDDEIWSDIETVFRWNPDINEADIKVSVEGGWVTLEGTVDTLWQKYRAEDLATDVRGILGITNKLSVVPTEDIVDEKMAGEIVAALDRDVNVDINSVDVRVENGVVTLSGTVPTWKARLDAYEKAVFTKGVIDINDNLVIQGELASPT